MNTITHTPVLELPQTADLVWRRVTVQWEWEPATYVIQGPLDSTYTDLLALIKREIPRDEAATVISSIVL